jgi:hypothetical protein
MNKLGCDDLYSLEKYATIRADFRKKVMAHKVNRRIELGENFALYFEDRTTMHYQIQEILRAEKMFEAAGIRDEIDAYNPLIPDGTNLKATLMIQYEDVDERKHALTQLIGVEVKVWLKVGGHGKIFPIADEDLERETAEKTSAVHFLRFEFDSAMIAGLKAGSTLSAGVDHPEYSAVIDSVADNIRQSLLADFD